MDCLNNYIGLRGLCDEQTPVSSLYINDLAGISLKSVANLSNEEQASVTGVWNEIYRRSVAELEGDILIHMQKYFRTNILRENILAGEWKIPYEDENISSYYKGIAISIEESKNTELFINDVKVYLKSDLTSAIYIYDYNDGRLLDTITFAGVTGINHIPINKKYSIFGQRKKIFICYEGDFETIKTRLNSSNYAVLRNAKIAIGSSVLEDNMSFISEGSGLVVNFNVICSIDNFICSMRDFFKIPLWYKLGANVMMERMTSDRINRYTLVNMDKAKELYDMYQAKYIELINTILNNLEPEGDTCCFPCNKQRTYKYQTP